VIAPDQGSRGSALGDLLLLLAVVIFLEMGGAGILATALARSYEAVPLAVPSPGPASLQSAAFLVIVASAKLIEAAIGLAAPAVVALLLADLALGSLGRAVPQMPLYFTGMPAKALLGVGAVLAGLATLDSALTVGSAVFLACWRGQRNSGADGRRWLNPPPLSRPRNRHRGVWPRLAVAARLP